MWMRRRVILGTVAALALVLTVPALASAATRPSFGPNVIVFTPGMSQASIQSTLNSIATQQVPDQFGTQRYAIFFAPGTYGSAADTPVDVASYP